jgi:hypothetical protein
MCAVHYWLLRDFYLKKSLGSPSSHDHTFAPRSRGRHVVLRFRQTTVSLLLSFHSTQYLVTNELMLVVGRLSPHLELANKQGTSSGATQLITPTLTCADCCMIGPWYRGSLKTMTQRTKLQRGFWCLRKLSEHFHRRLSRLFILFLKWILIWIPC